MNQYVNDFNRTTQIYYDELKKYKPLSSIKEKRLFKKYKRGSVKAKNEILEANLRFVFDTAKRYTGRGVPISELISEGNMGLLRAIDKFDETKGVKFISYAVWWIRQAMLEAIKKKKAIDFVDIEPNIGNDTSIDKKSSDDEYDDIPSFNEFSNESEEKHKEVTQNQKKIISELFEILTERERDIIENFYGINNNKELTLTDIGKKYGLSTERVRQIKKKSLIKLRSKILLYDDLENLFT